MFNLDSITLNNFRSYKGEHKFVFPKTSGLYYLSGENLWEPALGSNGAGKSTFIDAITWCLYGHTTRGLKANEILSWHVSVGAQVALDLTVGDDCLRVKRTQKPNGLFLGDKPVDQKELETHLRLNYTAFTHSILSPQFGEPFFSLKTGDKLTLFSDINNLDYWLEKSDESTKVARKQEQDLAELTQHMDRAEGQIETIKDDIIELKKKQTVYEKERSSKLKYVEHEVGVFLKRIRTLNGQLDEDKGTLDALKAQIAGTTGKAQNIMKNRDILLETISSLSADKKILQREMADFINKHDEYKALGGYCPCCEQNIDQRHATDVIKHLLTATLKTEIKYDNCSKTIKKTMETLALLRLDIGSHTNKLSALKNDQCAVEDGIIKTNLRLTQFNAHLDAAEIKIAEIKSGDNPYKKLLDDKLNSLLSTEAKLSQDLKAFEVLTSQHIATSYWSKGFKQIRLFIIEQAFQTLEIEVNNCLAQLGMVDWQVTFDVERENKKGGITKGFIVLIKSPSNPAPVRWENWSGGETQRLQLAGDLGLANLIMHQAGLQNCIEFFDEPSTHLSSQGMMALADMLHERAITEAKSIWIADHTSISNFGEFQGIITARKTKNGSDISYG